MAARSRAAAPPPRGSSSPTGAPSAPLGPAPSGKRRSRRAEQPIGSLRFAYRARELPGAARREPHYGAGAGPGGHRGLGQVSTRPGSAQHGLARPGTTRPDLTGRAAPGFIYRSRCSLPIARMTLSGLGCRLQTCSCLATEWFNSTFRARGRAPHPRFCTLGWWEKGKRPFSLPQSKPCPWWAPFRHPPKASFPLLLFFP